MVEFPTAVWILEICWKQNPASDGDVTVYVTNSRWRNLVPMADWV
jgi:hypothetical protein